MQLYKHSTYNNPTLKIVSAIILFFIFPLIGFTLGMMYQNKMSSQQNITFPANSLPTDIPPSVSVANPAAVYCIDQGGDSIINTLPDGSQSGDCLLPDGKICEEWNFFRTKVCTPKGIPQITAFELNQGWYWGSSSQKKPGTPSNWKYREGGRNSCWYTSNKACGGFIQP